MCGIAGIYNIRGAAPPKEQELQAMAAKLRHRGPDGVGVYRDEAVGFAHACSASITFPHRVASLKNVTTE